VIEMATIAPTAALEGLAAMFRGTLLTEDDPGYDEARRIYNGLIDRRPAVIARCSGVADVVAALGFAREHELPVAVRGGGHSVAGYGTCDDGLVIDLRPMKGIWVDHERRVARAQAGLDWGDFDRETQLHGLATTGGRVSTTGISGLILGSGSGWLERKHGLSADNLLSVEVVTADGRLVRASESENPDLFWGLRGGSGNFGIATSFELQLHPVGPLLLAGMVLHSFSKATDVLHHFREFMASAPDEVIAALAFLTAPPAPFVPDELQGRPAVGIITGWVGDPDEGAAALRPLREFAAPEVDLVQPMPYVALQSMLDAAYPSGLLNYWKAENLKELSDDAIDVIVERAAKIGSPMTTFLVIPLGGALGRVPDDATALGDRDTPWQFHALSVWADSSETDTHVGWTRETAAALQPFTRPGVYLNYTSDEGEERVQSTYGAKYARLVALKDAYDPDNVFRINQNIKPSSGRAAG
jgi:FAD/FMN-containing dehydrogenase